MIPKSSPQRATVMTLDQAPTLHAYGIDVKVLLASEASGGAVSVLMGWHQPGEGAPDHFHTAREEMMFIVEGTYEITVGDETNTLGPGGLVRIPRNLVHRFRNVGQQKARMLDWSLPGGQDHFFAAIARLAAEGLPLEKALQASQEFDTHFIAAR